MKQEIKERIEKIKNGEVPEGYKKADLSPIVPLDWDHKEMSEYIELVSGQHIAADEYNTLGQGIPYLTGPADFNERKIYKTKYTLKPKATCKEGDILITVKGSGVGKTVIADDEYCISRQLMAIRGPKGVLGIIYHNLKLNESVYNKDSAGLIPGIGRTDILNKKISLPRDQREMIKIASILSTWDKAIELKEKLIEEKKKQKKGLMQKLLTGEVRLSGFDGEWKEVTLGEVATYESSNISISSLENFTGQELYPVYSATGIFKYVDFYNIEFDYIGIVKDGAGAGRINRSTKKSSVISTMGCIINSKDIEIEYLYQYMQLVDFSKYIKGSTIPHLYFKDYRSEIIMLPSSEEQKSISNVLSLADKEISLLEQELDALKLQKKGLMQLLLTGIVRVNTEN